MSVKKIVGGILSVGMIVAGVVTGNPMLIASGVSGVVSTLRKTPKPPQQALSRLQPSFVVHEPFKIVFGHTAGATDVRYQAYTGADQEYLEQIVAVAGHECEGEAELWLGGKKAWSEAGGVTSDFAGYLTVQIRNPGTSANGIAIDSTWTAECTLTGCCYLHIKYKLTGNSKKAESPFANGIPSEMVIPIKGALVPDLRVAGVDPDDQSTWVYSDDGSDSGRNPAWARLFYELGWRINGKLALGRGLPSSRLNLATYETAANHCDEPVALDAGGSEPRYRHDMVYSEGEAPPAVLSNINDAMNAVATDDGGRIGIICLHDDLDDPDQLVLTDDDIASGGGNEKWNPEEELNAAVNIVRGQYTDPSDTGLYQMAPEAEVALGDAGDDYGSVDGIQRLAPFAAPQVQSATQWTRLAKLRLMRAQHTGVYRVNLKARGWRCRMYRTVSFTHRARGWVDKKFRVIGMGMPAGNVVPVVLKETSAAEFDWDAAMDELDPATATPPVVWAWQNNPLLGALDDLQTDVDGKIACFIGSTPPTAEGEGDLWFDTAAGKWKRWNGSTWEETEDSDIALALLAASDAQATADGKITTFYQATAPTADAVGDLWIDSDETPQRVRRWSGSAWVVVTPASLSELDAAAAAALSSATSNIAAAAADNVLTIEEKKGTGGLVESVAVLDARHSYLTARATGLGISTTVVTAARTAFVTYFLPPLYPAWNDVTQNTTLGVANISGFNPALTSWANSTLGNRSFASPYYTLSDTSSGAQQVVNTGSLTCLSSTAYTLKIKVKKDAVAAGTRTVNIRLETTNGTTKVANLHFDTQTGTIAAADATWYSYLVGNYDADHWLVVGTLVTNSNNTLIRWSIFPAFGTNGGSSNTPTGSIEVKEAQLIAGYLENLGRDAFRYRLKDWSAQLEALAKAISEADVIAASSAVAGLTDIEIKYDHTGAAQPGQLTRNETYSLVRNGSTVSSGLSWTYTVISGTVNGFTSASGAQTLSGAGPVTFAISSLGSAEAKVQIKAVDANGVPFIATVRVYKNQSAAPTSGGSGGGTSASVTSFSSFSGTSMTSIMPGSPTEFVVTAGGTSVALTCTLDIDNDLAATTACTVLGIFQWWNGSSWADVGTETTASGTVTRAQDPLLGTWFTISTATLNISTSKTGLTAGTSNRFRLMMRRHATNSAGANYYPTGTAGAQG